MKESRNQLNTSSGTSPNNDKMAANALSTASAAVTQAYEASESLLVAQVAAANESQNTVVADWVKKAAAAYSSADSYAAVASAAASDLQVKSGDAKAVASGSQRIASAAKMVAAQVDLAKAHASAAVSATDQQVTAPLAKKAAGSATAYHQQIQALASKTAKALQLAASDYDRATVAAAAGDLTSAGALSMTELDQAASEIQTLAGVNDLGVQLSSDYASQAASYAADGNGIYAQVAAIELSQSVDLLKSANDYITQYAQLMNHHATAIFEGANQVAPSAEPPVQPAGSESDPSLDGSDTLPADQSLAAAAVTKEPGASSPATDSHVPSASAAAVGKQNATSSVEMTTPKNGTAGVVPPIVAPIVPVGPPEEAQAHSGATPPAANSAQEAAQSSRHHGAAEQENAQSAAEMALIGLDKLFAANSLSALKDQSSNTTAKHE